MSNRIGVFICHCGTNIGGIVNVPEVVKYALSLPNVVCAEENLYTCSDDGLSSIRNRIKQDNLNRVVVASCTPRTHEPLFKKNCEAAGLNKYLFEFVNLREHCSWVHMEQKQEATLKAKDLVRMGVAKVGLLTPETDLSSEVAPISLVIGGGISGLTAALTLAGQGYQVELIEKKDKLGGLLQGINRVFPDNKPTADYLVPLINSVLNHPNINTHFKVELVAVRGFIGKFSAKIKENQKIKELKIGTIIVAVGATEYKPEGVFAYGRFENVMTQLELEQKYKTGFRELKQVVMINCVGARIDERPYCGRFCCITAIKNAILIKEADPEAEVTILQRDIMACGRVFEEYYQKALQAEVRFVRYTMEKPPLLSGKGKSADSVKVYHELMGKNIELKVDAVVLTTPLVPAEDNPRLSQIMKIPIGIEGFFLEAHQKLRPVEFPVDGIYLAGCARYPTELVECVAQGYAAAAKAAAPMSQGKVVSDAVIAEVNNFNCSACGRCLNNCPFGAVDWTAWKTPAGEKRVALVNATECKGCGVCVASCLSSAMQLKGYTDEAILSVIASALTGHISPSKNGIHV